MSELGQWFDQSKEPVEWGFLRLEDDGSITRLDHDEREIVEQFVPLVVGPMSIVYGIPKSWGAS